MKHATLATLALASLTAAASAQTAAAAPAGLSYNRIGITRSSQKTVASQNVLSASVLLGSSNFLALAESRGDSGTVIGLGYVFKNVALGVDATVSATSALDFTGNGTVYGLNLRRALNEVIPGLEIAVGYSHQSTNSFVAQNNRVLSYELAYNINKQYSVAYGIQDVRSGTLNNSANKAHNVSVRYSF